MDRQVENQAKSYAVSRYGVSFMRTIRYICTGCKKTQTFDGDNTTVSILKSTTPVKGRETFATTCPRCGAENTVEFEPSDG